MTTDELTKSIKQLARLAFLEGRARGLGEMKRAKTFSNFKKVEQRKILAEIVPYNE